jgi:glycosyltransferase involved in cell wall biosynthesis
LPLFSVIIPAYNRAGLIGRTLQSVLSQQHTDLEVIVVDDGSTDGTPDVVRSFGSRVQLLHQENKGPGAARNKGLAAAIGQYAAFLDSDDVWLPWTIATYTRVIEQHNRPAFIVGKPFIFESETDPLHAEPADLTVEVFPDYYASGDQWRWYSASSFVMNRQMLVDVGGFTDDWVNAEDADAAMRMGIAPKFAQITSPYTFGYRKHDGSAMTNMTRTLAGIRRLVDQEEAGRFPGGPGRAMERRRIITTYSRPLALDLLKRNEYPAARDLFRRTFRWNLTLGRWRFLLGFLAMWAGKHFRSDPIK